MVRIEKATIAVVVSEEEGAVKSTANIQVNSFRCGISEEFLRWEIYLGHDKDQSPTGYSVVLYEPHLDFPGLFRRRELLNHWDGPLDEDRVSLAMQIVCLQFEWGYPKGGQGLQKEHMGEFLRRVLNATYPTSDEKKSAADIAREKEAAHAEIVRLMEAGELQGATSLAADHGFVIVQQGGSCEVYPAESGIAGR